MHVLTVLRVDTILAEAGEAMHDHRVTNQMMRVTANAIAIGVPVHCDGPERRRRSPQPCL